MLSTEQPVDERNLKKGNSGDGSPGESFAEAQTGLAVFTEPKLHRQGTDVDGIAVAQDGLLDTLAIDIDQRFRLGHEDKTCGGLEVELQMLVPDAILLRLQVSDGGTTDPYRKTAGGPCRP